MKIDDCWIGMGVVATKSSIWAVDKEQQAWKSRGAMVVLDGWHDWIMLVRPLYRTAGS